MIMLVLQKHAPRKFETNAYVRPTHFHVFVQCTVPCKNYQRLDGVQYSIKYVNKPFVLSKQSFEVSPIGVSSSHTGAQRLRHRSIASSMTFCSRPVQARSNQAPLQISNVEYRRTFASILSTRITVNVTSCYNIIRLFVETF